MSGDQQHADGDGYEHVGEADPAGPKEDRPSLADLSHRARLAPCRIRGPYDGAEPPAGCKADPIREGETAASPPHASGQLGVPQLDRFQFQLEAEQQGTGQLPIGPAGQDLLGGLGPIDRAAGPSRGQLALDRIGAGFTLQEAQQG